MKVIHSTNMIIAMNAANGKSYRVGKRFDGLYAVTAYDKNGNAYDRQIVEAKSESHALNVYLTCY